MAEPVEYNTNDLKLKLAELFVECSVRANREDVLVAAIQERDGKIAQLEALLEEQPKRKKTKEK